MGGALSICSCFRASGRHLHDAVLLLRASATTLCIDVEATLDTVRTKPSSSWHFLEPDTSNVKRGIAGTMHTIAEQQLGLVTNLMTHLANRNLLEGLVLLLLLVSAFDPCQTSPFATSIVCCQPEESGLALRAAVFSLRPLFNTTVMEKMRTVVDCTQLRVRLDRQQASTTNFLALARPIPDKR